MSLNDHISLIDLSQQFRFEIDDQIKKELCFGETLVISCGHYEGDIEVEESSDSEWSCHDTTETEISEEVKQDTAIEIKDKIDDEAVEDETGEEEGDFHFFFFSDCNKVLPQDSKTSVILVDGVPKFNPSAKPPVACTCDKNKKGVCDCSVKLPCKCGAKTTAECLCSKLNTICICDESNPQTVCTCKGSQICVCNPDGKIRPKCTCDKVDKPCVCYPDKFPSPVCTCKYKPKFGYENMKVITEMAQEEHIECTELEEHEETTTTDAEEGQEPCECQKERKPFCTCLKGQECICNTNTCICGVQKTCVCEPVGALDPICKSEDSKSICSCDVLRECTCNAESATDCKCFPEKVCNCGDPENCKCFTICECTEPCICDTNLKDAECICLDKAKQLAKGLVCTCPVHGQEKDPMKLTKVRAGKHDYRWCHQVDPRHTYFDYGYDRHDKISYKIQEREKLKILGLADKEELESCPVHGIEAPLYKKKVRKPSIDCCSSVGGISISVETLGEDKDKFLVQVVSHASKEGAKTGSKLVSILDCHLHTMEENRTEYITKKEIMKERRSYMTICENGYYNKVTRVCGGRDTIKRFYHSFEDSHNFLLEGANIVLLRYFGLSRYRGTVKTDCVLMDGTICESIYVCLGVSQAIVNGKPLFVVKVERHIIEPSGLIHQTLTVLSLRVSHEWADNAYMLHINPLLRVVPEKDEIEPHAPLRENWREDLQLLSDYLDFKSTRTSEGARYMEESGILTGTIRDYLQALLLLRPVDALHFTRHYFGSVLSSLELPHDEYFDPTSKHVRYYFFEQ
ncbi:unnamed protein product [Diatraea saccharalis]|uniref:Ciliogenesis-associated TTC17-interacting protein N-terminal domain-containing protein n=1 Tax=Diatraea saccharalis TaxID=40085 RepID=A0A9N9QXZ3_9NEOP|nr:unnamed protein product [Diatraea saccharalis]